jgi:hypothetical protein
VIIMPHISIQRVDPHNSRAGYAGRVIIGDAAYPFVHDGRPVILGHDFTEMRRHETAYGTNIQCHC